MEQQADAVKKNMPELQQREFNSQENIGGLEVEPRLGISPDYINAWSTLPMVAGFMQDMPDVAAGMLNPVPTYEEYIRDRDANDPAKANRVLSNSNSEKVVKLDCLVEEFNKALVSIKASKDAAQIHEFVARAQALIQGIEAEA